MTARHTDLSEFARLLAAGYRRLRTVAARPVHGVQCSVPGDIGRDSGLDVCPAESPHVPRKSQIRRPA
jgi:hypothetical protein